MGIRKCEIANFSLDFVFADLLVCGFKLLERLVYLALI
jgi:hypothetical protein